MWALLFSSVMILGPSDPSAISAVVAPLRPTTLNLETVNGQVVKVHASLVAQPDSQAGRAATAAFLDAMKRRFEKRKAGAP